MPVGHRVSFVLIVCCFLSACAANTKIVIPSYSAPREYKKIAEIESGGESQDGRFLALAIDPEVDGTGKEPGIGPMLVNSVKEGLTSTNFITIYPIFDEAYVQLDINVISYDFQQTADTIKADMQASFTIVKGVTEYLSKTYSARATRSSSNPSLLPSKNKVLLDLSKEVSAKFVADITPLKTNQLRELKSMPGELEYILTYAKRGNFESAIDDMEAYPGTKGAGFYYNLAVMYEAQASKSEDMKMFRKADAMYRKSMMTGGSGDELIVANKARFDNFYRLFKMTDAQKRTNEQLNNELDSVFGGTE